MEEMEDWEQWLSPEDLAFVRAKVPILYVTVVPLIVEDDGSMQRLGMILTATDEGLSHCLISGRVLHHETVRNAILRHIWKELGSLPIPLLPANLAPFSITESFPTPGFGLHDERQHAVSMNYMVPIFGDCAPASSALEINWFTPGELATAELQQEILPNHLPIVRQAIASLG